MLEIVFTGEDPYLGLFRFRKEIRAGAQPVAEICEDLATLVIYEGEHFLYRCEKLASLDTRLLSLFISSDVSLTVFLSESMQNSKALKALKKEGTKVDVIHRLSEEKVSSLCAAYAAKNKCRITQDACAELISRTAYLEGDASDFGTIACEMDKLVSVCAEKGVIEATDVEAYCSRTSVADAFGFVDCVVQGKREAAMAAAKLINAEKGQSAKALGLLMRQGRIACKADLMGNEPISIKKDALSVRYLNRMDAGSAKKLLAVSDRWLKEVKRGCPDDAALVLATFQAMAEEA